MNEKRMNNDNVYEKNESYIKEWMESVWCKEENNDGYDDDYYCFSSTVIKRREKLLNQLHDNFPTKATTADDDIWLELALLIQKLFSHEKQQLCYLIHVQRMKHKPILWCTDSIRLINHSAEMGLFHTDDHSSNSGHVLGVQVRQLLQKHHYTYSRITQTYLRKNNNNTIRDGNYFFQNRHALQQENKISCALCVLVRLYVFGLSVSSDILQQYLEPCTIDLLQQAHLLTNINSSDIDVWIGTVQIYPLQPSLFSPNCTKCHDHLYIMTDWPMESLFQPTNTAVMSIGCDSLELVALQVLSQPKQYSKQCVLDLCCGSGIQGIVYASTHKNDCEEVLFIDLNPRALQFTKANLALNQLTSSISTKYHVIHGDLFQPSQVQNTDGFDVILANPPFVIPTTIDQPTAMYAVGGTDIDGLEVTRTILHTSHKYLCSNSGILLMVTELSNIQDIQYHSHTLLLQTPQQKLDILYCIQDVESIDEYLQERQEEHAFPATKTTDLSLSQQLSKMQIENRALVILKLQQNEKNEVILHALDKTMLVPPVQDDDEDVLLTPIGLQFIQEAFQ